MCKDKKKRGVKDNSQDSDLHKQDGVMFFPEIRNTGLETRLGDQSQSQGLKYLSNPCNIY